MTAAAQPDLAAAAEAYLAALVARDGTAARAAVAAALDAGATVEDVYLDVLAPALRAIGDRWATGAATVADEHVATALTASILGELGPRVRAEPSGGRLAVLACTPDECHELGLRMVSDLLQARGWEVLDAGASVPADALAALVDEERPDAVGLSTSTAGRMPGVEAALAALRALDETPLLVVGGPVWTAEAAAHAPALGADHVVRDARLLAPLLERHLTRRDA